MDALELSERLKSIDINKILDIAIDQTKDLLLDLIRSQMLKGEKSDGSPIGHYSLSQISKRYVELKFKKGLFQGGSYPKYDLFFKGEFYRLLEVYNDGGNYIEIVSTDPKLEYIEKNTGNLDDTLTLNSKNTEIYAREIKPIIQNLINGHFGI